VSSPAATSARACKIFDKLQLERSASSGAIEEAESVSLLIKISKIIKIIKIITKGAS
jgi:hypothetical protein